MTTLPKTWLELAREGKASVDEVWGAFNRTRDAKCVCDDCENECDYIIGCPDGAEICQQCFNAGQH